MTDRSWFKDASLIAHTGARLLAEDPMHALVQVSRRLPAGLRRHLEPKPGPASLTRAFRAWLSDHPADAARMLAALSTGPQRPHSQLSDSSPAGRLRELLAVALGELDAEASSPAGRARALWQLGALTEAIEELADSNSVLAQRIESERRMLTPGMEVRLTRRTPLRDGTGVLMSLTNCLPWTRSGYTARSRAICSALKQAGVDVSVVTRIGYPVTVGLPARPVLHHVDGVPHHRLPVAELEPTLDGRAGQQAALVRDLAEKLRPSVLHTTTDYTNAVATRAVAEATGLPWVYEMRGMLELTWIASRPLRHQPTAAASERVRLLRAREAELAGDADAVICLSRVQKDDLVGRGVEADKIVVAPNAVADKVLERPRTDPLTARERLGLPREGFWVGTVTSMVDYEGLDTLVEAVALAREAGHDLRAALVGDGVARPGLIHRVHELGLNDAIVFPGRVPADEALHWHEALDVFTVPRRDTPVCRYVTPLKPLEAMALGRPVLASDLPALAEVTADGAVGALVPPDDPQAWASALIAAQSDRQWRRTAAERGRAHAARHTWAHVAADYCDLYRRLSEES